MKRRYFLVEFPLALGNVRKLFVHLSLTGGDSAGNQFLNSFLSASRVIACCGKACWYLILVAAIPMTIVRGPSGGELVRWWRYGGGGLG